MAKAKEWKKKRRLKANDVRVRVMWRTVEGIKGYIRRNASSSSASFHFHLHFFFFSFLDYNLQTYLFSKIKKKRCFLIMRCFYTNQLQVGRKLHSFFPVKLFGFCLNFEKQGVCFSLAFFLTPPTYSRFFS